MNANLPLIKEVQEFGKLNIRSAMVEHIFSRCSVSPKRQGYPAPSREEINLMVEASLTAPDHCDIRPGHFIEIPTQRRRDLAEIFLCQKRKQYGQLKEHIVTSEYDKAMSAPTLIAAYAKLSSNHPKVPAYEQLISAGAAIQNFMLCAHGLGYGSILLSGERVRNPSLHESLGLGSNDHLIGFISLGTIISLPSQKHRHPPNTHHSMWC